jgi:glycosyltransferase involved in cell wall biosynthesis
MSLPKQLSPKVRLIPLGISKKYSFKIFLKLLLILNREKPDVVHVHLHNSFYYTLLVSFIFRKIKFVHTIHSGFYVWEKIYSIVYSLRFFNNRFFHICVSQSIYRCFVRRFPWLKFFWIDNGIREIERTSLYGEVSQEVEGLKKDHKTKIFLAIGNYSSHKNFTLLARVFKQLELEGNNFALLILGDDSHPDKKGLREVKNIKGSRTFILGFRENVVDYLSMADALVISSRNEGMPLVVLEAFSAGLPVISAPAGGLVDLVKEGKNGFIAKDVSEEQLYQAIIRFLNAKKEDIDRINKQNQKEFAEKYSITVCKKNYDEIYKLPI